MAHILLHLVRIVTHSPRAHVCVCVYDFYTSWLYVCVCWWTSVAFWHSGQAQLNIAAIIIIIIFIASCFAVIIVVVVVVVVIVIAVVVVVAEYC